MSASTGNELALEMDEDDPSPQITFEKDIVTSDKTMMRKRARGGFPTVADRRHFDQRRNTGGRDDGRNSYEGIADPFLHEYCTTISHLL